MTDWNETSKSELEDIKPESENPKEVKTTGIQSIQGIEKSKPADNSDTAVPKQAPPEEIEFPGPPDPSELKYELGSPHKDYQAYKDLQAAKRQHELGQQAATIGPEPGVSTFFEAAANTLSAHKEAQGSDETAMDEYFYKKYGRTPYTTDAYPKEDEE
jgi:hypothetical protein